LFWLRGRESRCREEELVTAAGVEGLGKKVAQGG